MVGATSKTKVSLAEIIPTDHMGYGVIVSLVPTTSDSFHRKLGRGIISDSLEQSHFEP